MPSHRTRCERRARIGENTVDPSRHLRRGAPRKSQQHDAARIGAIVDEMNDAMRQRAVLPEPAPAMMRSGPASASGNPPCSTARRCCGLSFSRRAASIGHESFGTDRLNHGPVLFATGARLRAPLRRGCRTSALFA